MSAKLPAILKKAASGRLVLASPSVGLLRCKAQAGWLLGPDQPIGVLKQLGRRYLLTAPEGASGTVVEHLGPEHRPVAYGDELLIIDPSAAVASASSAASSVPSTGLVVKAPMSGRFYLRPGPHRPPFVEVGSVLELGASIGLLEVMKTFNRVQYGGPGLPPTARVTSILRGDDDDVNAGDPLIEVEPVAN